jgi:branched-subunit amino acid transport protein
MTDAGYWLAVVGIGLTGVVTRSSFLVFGARFMLPPKVEHALRFAPAAALSAIVAPAILQDDHHALWWPENPRVWAALVCAVVMARTRGMLWAMAAGGVVYAALRAFAA